MPAVEPRHEDALRRIYEADLNSRRSGQVPGPFRSTWYGEDEDEIEHPGWDRSWASPSGETIEDLAELSLLRVDTNQPGTPFSLTMKGREEAAKLLAPPSSEAVAQPVSSPHLVRDPRKVAVMYGRDMKAKQWMYAWLPRVGLEPLEWSHLITLTGSATPYSGEAVEAAFRTAQAVVVLFTPDEIGALHPDLIAGDGSGLDERTATQPRLNVILEAGMALKSHENETVLVEIGSTRPVSDLAGRNTVRLKGDAGGLNELANRLERAGCRVNRGGTEWLETEELQRLPALQRKADTEYIPAPLGGISPVAYEGSFYWVLRARGTEIACRGHDGEGWIEWTPVGSVDEEPIGLAAASAGPAHIEAFVLLPRGEVLHNWRLKGYDWQPRFHSLGKPFGAVRVNRISAGSKGEGHEEVFVESVAGEIAHLWLEGSWRRNIDALTALGDGWWRF